MADLYPVKCPKCNWLHFTVLNESPKEGETIEVICKSCEPLKEEKGEYGF